MKKINKKNNPCEKQKQKTTQMKKQNKKNNPGEKKKQSR